MRRWPSQPQETPEWTGGSPVLELASPNFLRALPLLVLTTDVRSISDQSGGERSALSRG